MLELYTDIWSAFKQVRDSCKPKTVDICTGYLGDGADRTLENLGVRARIIFGLSKNCRSLPKAQRDEVQTLQRTHQLCVLSGLHSKLYIFDEQIVIIGSANFTKNGLDRLHEMVVLSDDVALAARATEEFCKHWGNARQFPSAVTPTKHSSSESEGNGASGLGAAEGKGTGRSPFSDSASRVGAAERGRDSSDQPGEPLGDQADEAVARDLAVQRGRMKKFEDRLRKCPTWIQDTFGCLHRDVKDWADVRTKIDSSSEGLTFYRERPQRLGKARPSPFFRLDPKHSERDPNIGVGFYGLSREQIESVPGFEVRKRKNEGRCLWIRVRNGDERYALLDLAREAYKTLAPAADEE